MMNKLVPKIKSGDQSLLISETICFDSSQGISVFVPTFNKTTQKQVDVIFRFIFEYDTSPPSPNDLNTTIHGNMVTLIIRNFGNKGLPTGLFKPLAFKIGIISMYVYFFGQTIPFNDEDKNKRLVNFTISIYQGK